MRRLRAGLVTPLPGGPGPPSVPTKRDCPQGLDAARTKGGESCPDRGPGSGPVRARKLRPRGQKRRDGAPSGERASQSAPTPPGVGLMVAPLGAPSPRQWPGAKEVPGASRERLRRTRRRSNNTGAHARPFGIRAAKLGCLTIESVRTNHSSPRQQGRRPGGRSGLRMGGGLRPQSAISARRQPPSTSSGNSSRGRSWRRQTKRARRPRDFGLWHRSKRGRRRS